MQGVLKRWGRRVVGGATQRFSSDDDEWVNLEYARQNSQDAIRIVKEGNSAS